MRVDCFEVLLIDSVTNQPFVEKEIDGVIYAISVPGCEYYVTVNAHKTTDGNWPAKHLRIGLFVDNVDVQYWKRLDFTDPSVNRFPKITATFWGYQQSTSTLRSFTIASPTEVDLHNSASGREGGGGGSGGGRTGNVNGGVGQQAMGEIKVVLFDAELTDGVFKNESAHHVVPEVAGILTNEGRKFWQQPSLTTKAGRQVDKEKFSPLPRWRNCTETPRATLILQYHRHDALNLMEMLLTQQRQQKIQNQIGKRKRDDNIGDDDSDGDVENVLVKADGNEKIRHVIDLTSDAEDGEGEGENEEGEQGTLIDAHEHNHNGELSRSGETEKEGEHGDGDAPAASAATAVEAATVGGAINSVGDVFDAASLQWHPSQQPQNGDIEKGLNGVAGEEQSGGGKELRDGGVEGVGGADDEVCVVEMSREVPLLDISDDVAGPRWGSITQRR